MSSSIDGATRRIWENGSTTVSFKTAQRANQRSTAAHLPAKSLFSNLFSRERNKSSASSGVGDVPATPCAAVKAAAPASNEDVFAFM